MKTFFRVVSAAAVVLMLLTACNDPIFVSVAPDEAASDLAELDALLAAIQAGLALMPDDAGSTPAASKAIDPSKIGVLIKDAGPPVVVYTPFEVYTNYGGTGSNEVRVPSGTDFFSDYYNPGDQAYFTIDKEKGDYYRIKLYIYPSTDFNVKYAYEEYLVFDNGVPNDWDWTNMNQNRKPDRYVKLQTYYADGTVGERSLVWSSAGGTDYYPAFAVPGDVLANLDYYLYPRRIPMMDFDGLGNYSSNTNVTVKGEGFTILGAEFYTETPAASNQSGVGYYNYDTKGKRSVDYYTVTRSQSDTSAGTKTIRSMTVDNSDEAQVTYTEINRIDITTVDGKLKYDSSTDVWYDNPKDIADQAASPRALDTLSSQYGTLIDVTETAVDSNAFAGIITKKNGAKSETYDVEIKRNDDGKAVLRWTWGKYGMIELELEDITDFDLEIKGGKGQFQGYYENGAIRGKYIKGLLKRESDIEITPEGIAVDGILVGRDKIKN